MYLLFKQESEQNSAKLEGINFSGGQSYSTSQKAKEHGEMQLHSSVQSHS